MLRIYGTRDRNIRVEHIAPNGDATEPEQEIGSYNSACKMRFSDGTSVLVAYAVTTELLWQIVEQIVEIQGGTAVRTLRPPSVKDGCKTAVLTIDAELDDYHLIDLWK